MPTMQPETGENRNIETVYSYNEKNQLIHTEEFLSDGSRRRNTFTYSKQGSILREETESGISRYFYNSKNQQIRVKRADGQIQENRYDAEGLRHEMRENGKLLRFVYQNGELLYEEGGDKETASCHLGAGIEAVRRGQRTYYYHPDEQLSTALITDETGTIKNQYRYDAFGAGLEASEELPNRIRYTGQQYDEVTEQYYLRARYYNPILGRFLQEDVYQGDGLNLYAYCRNNPVVYWDPSGYGDIPSGDKKNCLIEANFGEEQEETLSRRSFREDMTPEEIEIYDAYWKDTIDPTEKGPFADGCIPARSKSQQFTADEREQINEIGRRTGCHTCGSTDPGTRSGNFIPDHQPVSATVPDGTPQVLYPQCKRCSCVQGGIIAVRRRKGLYQ